MILLLLLTEQVNHYKDLFQKFFRLNEQGPVSQPRAESGLRIH